jgi:drug/metabolite transporter superfamily protein YnfA
MRAADRSGTRRLLAELPQLVATGVLSAEAAQALENHYAAKNAEEPRRTGFILSAILGSLLVGAGIILLVAHNWDFLSRPIRCAIAFAPLILSHALAVFVLLKRNESTPWRESAAIFNSAAIGTAIALVAQTYQIQGDFARFILVWMLLAIPVVYLLQTSAGLSAYFIGAMVWVLSSKTGDFFGTRPNDLWVWPLLGLGLPAFVALLRRNRNGYGTLLAATALAVAAAFALGQTDEIGARSFWRCSFAGFWCVVYLIGVGSFKEWRPTRAHPFVIAGWLGILSLTIFLSFKDAWRTHLWQSAVDSVPRHFPDALAAGIQIAWVLVALLLGAWLFWKEYRSRLNLAPAVFAPVVLAAWGTAKRTRDPLVPSLLLNLFGLALGIFTLVRGVRAGRIYEANLGMLIIAALAFARFFDSDFEFVVRGIAFIAIGLGFLVTNLVVLKRRARP